MRVTFPSYNACDYVEVFRVTEWRNGCVFKTTRIGFARSSRPQQPNEVYSSLSTRLTREETITLDVME